MPRKSRNLHTPGAWATQALGTGEVALGSSQSPLRYPIGGLNGSMNYELGLPTESPPQPTAFDGSNVESVRMAPLPGGKYFRSSDYGRGLILDAQTGEIIETHPNAEGNPYVLFHGLDIEAKVGYYAESSNERLASYNYETGGLAWATDVVAFSTTRDAAVAGGLFVVALADSEKFVALDRETGEVQWAIDMAVGDYAVNVYTNSDGSKWWLFTRYNAECRAADGSVLWSKSSDELFDVQVTGLIFGSSKACQEETGSLMVMVKDPANGYAPVACGILNTSDGTVRWQNEYDYSSNSLDGKGFLFCDDVVVYRCIDSSGDHYWQSADATDGTELAAFFPPGGVELYSELVAYDTESGLLILEGASRAQHHVVHPDTLAIAWDVPDGDQFNIAHPEVGFVTDGPSGPRLYPTR